MTKKPFVSLSLRAFTTVSDMNDIRLKLAHARKRRGLSRAELAEQLGVSVATISRWENRKMAVNPLRIRDLETWLNTTGDEK